MATQLGDTLTTRDAFRRAILDDIVVRAELKATPMEGGPLDGLQVVTLGTLRDIVGEHLAIDLPPPSAKYAEVSTPATIATSAICPECRQSTEILVKLGPRLTVEGNSTELAVKAKSKAVTHMHGQLPLAEANGQETLDGALDAPIDDLRLRILRAVADVSDAWGAETDQGPPPTVDAIATKLELATESDRADLEESLHAYSQLEEPLVDVISAKGQPPHYVLTEAGIAFLAAADDPDDDKDDDSDEEPGGAS